MKVTIVIEGSAFWVERFLYDMDFDHGEREKTLEDVNFKSLGKATARIVELKGKTTNYWRTGRM